MIQKKKRNFQPAMILLGNGQRKWYTGYSGYPQPMAINGPDQTVVYPDQHEILFLRLKYVGYSRLNGKAPTFLLQDKDGFTYGLSVDGTDTLMHLIHRSPEQLASDAFKLGDYDVEGHKDSKGETWITGWFHQVKQGSNYFIAPAPAPQED